MSVGFPTSSDFLTTGLASSTLWTAGSLPNAFTMAMWVNFGGAAIPGGPVTLSNAAATGGSAGTPTAGIFIFGYGCNTTSNAWTGAISDNSFTNALEANIAVAASANTWYHLAVTYDGVGTTTGITVYFNGSSTGSTLTSHGTGIPTTGGLSTEFIIVPSAIFGNTFGQAGYEDVAWWNLVLSASEIAALAKGARAYTIRPKSQLLQLPLHTQGPSPQADYSGNKRNGTINGSPDQPVSGAPIMMFTPRWPQFLVPPIILPNVLRSYDLPPGMLIPPPSADLRNWSASYNKNLVGQDALTPQIVT